MSNMPDIQSETPEVSAFELLSPDPDLRLGIVRKLVDLFYDEMDSNPHYSRIRALHPPSLNGSRDKFFWFLSGWLGGPDLYQNRFGHPRLRMRHMPFHIESTDRDQWLMCMAHALAQVGLSSAQQETLMMSFFRTADWMRNQPDAPGSNAQLKAQGITITGRADTPEESSRGSHES